MTAQNRLPVGYLFSTGNGTPLSASNMLRSSFYPLCAGSLLIQAGVRSKDVQAILRHSKVSTTTDLYVHPYGDDLRSAVGKLGSVTA